MIRNVADFKNRTLMESNTFKSFILSTEKGFRLPQRDDILIHDYQTANSVTINTILSNYIVNLKYAWKLYGSQYGDAGESYFQIVEGLNESNQSTLSDQTKLILDVDDGVGSFKARDISLNVRELNIEQDTIKFVNLDTVWYGIVRRKDNEKSYDNIELIPDGSEYDGMNNFVVNPNPFGEEINPFNSPIRHGMTGTWGSSFNQYSRSHGNVVNSIVENLFYKNILDESPLNGIEYTKFGHVIPLCKYLVCLSDKFLGLKPEWANDGSFTGFTVFDIGSMIPNLDQSQYASGECTFMFAGFHVVGDSTTLFVVFVCEEGGNDKYHYLFLNKDSYDKVYGFSTIQSISVGNLITDPENVFSKVDAIKTLDSTNIALTDYGFWDLEPNTTNNVTYSYRQDLKDYKTSSEFNNM